MTQVTVNKNFNCDFAITIIRYTSNGHVELTPIVEDGVKWETDRQGSPGKLTFKVYKDKNKSLSFQEGDSVQLTLFDSKKGAVPIFNGWIFTKKRNKDGWIEVTAYDELRYFKNKMTYVYTNKTASDVVRMVANDCQVPVGTIENTTYVIGERVEDDQSMFDTIQNALDLTFVSTGKRYCLYASNHKVHLQDVNNLKTDIVINGSTAEDFDYTSSIDEETYNDIELYYDNDESNKREYYHAIDESRWKTWGRLRYTENVKNPANIQDRAKKLLELYNRKTRKLDVSNAFGDYRCRAGASVIVQLDLGDITVGNYMLIEKATHIFKKDEYRMDLTLGGTTEFV